MKIQTQGVWNRALDSAQVPILLVRMLNIKTMGDTLPGEKRDHLEGNLDQNSVVQTLFNIILLYERI